MKPFSLASYLLISLFFLFSCKSYKAPDYIFPKPVDTSTRPIEMQEKKTYSVNDVYADNEFDGARLNNFSQTRDGKYRAAINPENSPINSSPWYAFRLWSDTEQSIQLVLDYTETKHRYWPKVSKDGQQWERLDSTKMRIAADSMDMILDLDIGKEKLWLAAQENYNTTKMKGWMEDLASHADVRMEEYGKSKLGRPLWLMDISRGEVKKKETIVILSRQHPPEVTGFLACKAFIEEIMAEHQLAQSFRQKYRILIFPLLNPDGVDLGHWRHNAGGIDLNRDWAYYRQPEIRQTADYIVKTTTTNKSKVILGLDFHSTYRDVYYTNTLPPAQIAHFKDYWLQGIEEAISVFDFKTREAASGLGAPVSKGWFYQQFKAEAITYEIGDDTPREFIKRKGQVSALEMMELLIFR